MTLATAETLHTYYHVAAEIYEPGSIIGPIEDGNGFFVNSHPPGGCEARTEALLRRHMPPSEIRRDECVFLFETLQQCIAYGDSQHNNHAYFIYEVQTGNCCGHPMALVDRICRLLRDQSDTAEIVLSRVANEYWHPSREWRFLEFLCGSCNVVQRYARNEVNITELQLIICRMDYSTDHDSAANLANELISGSS